MRLTEDLSLYDAAYDGKLDVVQLLLDRGADVNQDRTNGRTPLWIAAARGQLAVAQLLLDRGADVNQANIDGQTPLWVAAREGKLAVAQLLLDNRADVNQAAKIDGVTPLLIAAYNSQLAEAQLLLFATKLSATPDVGLTLPSTIDEDPVIRQILECDQRGQFNDLRDNLNLIAQADKAQIVLKALYEHFSRCENLPHFLETFTARTTPAQLNRFNLNDSQSLLTLLHKLSEKEIPTEISTNIAQYAGAFSNKRLKALLEEHFNGEEVKDLITVTAEADTARALTPEGVLAVEDAKPNYLAKLITKLESLPSLPRNVIKNDDGTYTYHYDAGNGAAELAEKPLNQLTEDELTELNHQIEDELTELNHQIEARLARQQAAQEAELITKLESLSSLPGNVTKNDDGTYTYHYDAGNGAAEMAKKPLHDLTESELTELNSQIKARLARQQAAQEAEGQAEARTAARPPNLSHVERLAERRAQEEARGDQLMADKI